MQLSCSSSPAPPPSQPFASPSRRLSPSAHLLPPYTFLQRWGPAHTYVHTYLPKLALTQDTLFLQASSKHLFSNQRLFTVRCSSYHKCQTKTHSFHAATRPFHRHYNDKHYHSNRYYHHHQVRRTIVYLSIKLFIHFGEKQPWPGTSTVTQASMRSASSTWSGSASSVSKSSWCSVSPSSKSSDDSALT